MNTKSFSVILAATIWLLVAYRIGSRGIEWLNPYFQHPDWHLALLGLSVLIGFLKGSTVLKKSVKL